MPSSITLKHKTSRDPVLPDETIKVRFPGDISVPDLLANIDGFLHSSGFRYEGELAIVPKTDSDAPQWVGRITKEGWYVTQHEHGSMELRYANDPASAELLIGQRAFGPIPLHAPTSLVAPSQKL